MGSVSPLIGTVKIKLKKNEWEVLSKVLGTYEEFVICDISNFKKISVSHLKEKYI